MRMEGNYVARVQYWRGDTYNVDMVVTKGLQAPCYW